MSTSLSASAYVGNAGLPVFASATPDVGKPTSARNPNALDVLLITSTEEFLQDGAQELEHSAQTLQVPMQTVFVEQLAGTSKEEKSAALKQQLQALHQTGRIDADTQIIVNIHGSTHDGPHRLSNKIHSFSIGTSELVSVIRESGRGATPSPDSSAWQGTIHINACGVGRASGDLREDSGMSLLYAGKKISFDSNARAIFREMIRRIGEYRKDPAVNKFPSAQDFYVAAGSVSGEKVHMAGQGNLVQIRSGYLPHPTELTQTAVREKLERSLVAKVSHGKPATVQKMVDLLGPALKNIKESAPILIAVHQDTTDAEEKIKMILDAGVDINQRYGGGETALHVACLKAKKEVVSFLLQQGADVNSISYDGISPLDFAIHTRRLDLVELLVEAGADVNTRLPSGDSALHLACEQGDDRLIDLLLKKGADLHQRNKDHQTPLLKLIRAGHADRVLSLLARKDQEGKFLPFDDFSCFSMTSPIWEKSPKLFHALIGLYPQKSFALGEIFRMLKLDVGTNMLPAYFKPANVARHKILLSAFISEMLLSNERMPNYFKDFLRSPLTAKSFDYLAHMLNTPGLVEKMGADLQEIRDFHHKSGMVKTCEYFDAVLTKKPLPTQNAAT